MRTIEEELQQALTMRNSEGQRVPCTLVTPAKNFTGFVVTELSEDYVIGMDPDQRARFAVSSGTRQVWFIKKQDITQVFFPGHTE
ncbi:MAG: hypothetical protein KDB95_13015 [Flavobacteriales bacterium]|nr:hypothetical protein [Flavobacteriales bacterium]